MPRNRTMMIAAVLLALGACATQEATPPAPGQPPATAKADQTNEFWQDVAKVGGVLLVVPLIALNVCNAACLEIFAK